MSRELTPWERLDGIKHTLNLTNAALDSIVEGAVDWERSRIIKLLEAWLNDDNADFDETLALIKRDSDDLP